MQSLHECIRVCFARSDFHFINTLAGTDRSHVFHMSTLVRPDRPHGPRPMARAWDCSVWPIVLFIIIVSVFAAVGAGAGACVTTACGWAVAGAIAATPPVRLPQPGQNAAPAGTRVPQLVQNAFAAAEHGVAVGAWADGAPCVHDGVAGGRTAFPCAWTASPETWRLDV